MAAWTKALAVRTERPEGGFRSDEQDLGSGEQERARVVSEFGHLMEEGKFERTWQEVEVC